MKQTKKTRASAEDLFGKLEDLKSAIGIFERIVLEINNSLINDSESFYDCYKISKLLNSLADIGLKKKDLERLNLEGILEKINSKVLESSGFNLIRIINGFARLGYEKQEINFKESFFGALNKAYFNPNNA